MKKHAKGKMILIVTAFLIIFMIGLRQFLITGRDQAVEDTKTENSVPAAGERITRAEAYRMFSFFFYNKDERDDLPWIIDEADTDTWAGVYKNALANAGFFEAGMAAVEYDSFGNLTCDELKDYLVLLSGKTQISYADIVQQLPVRLRTAKAEDEVLLQEFLQLYEVCIGMVDEKSNEAGTESEERIVQQEFYILNTGMSDTELTGATVDVFITAEGTVYSNEHFQDYSDLLQREGVSYPCDFELVNENFRSYPAAEGYIDQKVTAYMCQNELVYIRAIASSETVLHNAWIISGENGTLLAYISGQTREFAVDQEVSGLQGVVGDITVKNRKVSSVESKNEIINGKVLMADSESVEIEGYGRLTLDENYKIYKIYDELEMERTNSILVGYTITDFVVKDGKICAALLKEQLKADNIRVLISLDASASYYHEEISLTSDEAYTVTHGETVRKCKSGEVLILTLEDFITNDDRIYIEPLSENGKVTVTSINRSYGNPSYRGTLEVSASVEGLLLINEVSLEEYLYAVVPSEMPTSYGEEAAKVQAVCARSYAYNQLFSGRYSKYGANVDDTVNCQVYNNVSENETSIFGVKDTYGQVLSYRGDIISAYYFSTSCGVTSSIEDVWADASETEYFSASLQLDDETQEDICSKMDKETTVQIELEQGDETAYVDLSGEGDFKTFIDENSLIIKENDVETKVPVSTWDSSYGWYRWYVTLDTYAISKQIDLTISQRYQANPSFIQTFVSGDETYITPHGTILHGSFESLPVTTIGRVTGMEVIKRAASGIITELLIIGTKNTILVKYQMNIRTLLAPVSTNLYLAEDSVIEGFSLMPSAYFYFEPVLANGTVTGFTFYGGGYGHGVGMSQNGVKALMTAGYTYEEILKHYYTGIELGFIY